MNNNNEMYRPEYAELGNTEYSLQDIEKAIEEKKIIYGVCNKSDEQYNITLKFNSSDNIKGFVKFEDIEYRRDNLETKPVVALSRVGRTVAVVPISIDKSSETIVVQCSRKEAQKLCRENYVDKLRRGDVIDVKVSRADRFGIFCDIGCGIIALIPTRRICVPSVNNARVLVGKTEKLKAVVYNMAPNGKIELSHKELLGTWEENVKEISPGETVIGTVVSIQDYGIFVRLTQNLSGLAQALSEEESANLDIKLGDQVSVYIKSITSENMKIKINIIGKVGNKEEPVEFKYFITDGHINKWVYNPSDYDYTRISCRDMTTDFTTEYSPEYAIELSTSERESTDGESDNK